MIVYMIDYTHCHHREVSGGHPTSLLVLIYLSTTELSHYKVRIYKQNESHFIIKYKHKYLLIPVYPLCLFLYSDL